MNDRLTAADIIAAPVLSLFSLAFYRKALKSSPATGIIFLLYFSLVASMIATLAFSTVLLPQAGEFMVWLKPRMPEINFTAQGVVSPVAQPFTLEHPKFGKLLILDTAAAEIAPEKIPDAMIYITKTKAVVRNEGRGESRILSLVPTGEQLADFKPFQVTGEVLETWYKKSIPLICVVVFSLVFIIFFVWKVLAGLIYSLAGLALNLFRTEKLKYAAVFNVTLFALTPVSLLQLLSFFPLPFRMSVNSLTSFLITVIYLAIAILYIKDEDETPPNTGSYAPV
jgi:hypothetical protein